MGSLWSRIRKRSTFTNKESLEENIANKESLEEKLRNFFQDRTIENLEKLIELPEGNAYIHDVCREIYSENLIEFVDSMNELDSDFNTSDVKYFNAINEIYDKFFYMTNAIKNDSFLPEEIVTLTENGILNDIKFDHEDIKSFKSLENKHKWCDYLKSNFDKAKTKVMHWICNIEERVWIKIAHNLNIELKTIYYYY